MSNFYLVGYIMFKRKEGEFTKREENHYCVLKTIVYNMLKIKTFGINFSLCPK